MPKSSSTPKPTPPPSPLVSLKEAARLLGCSQAHVTNLADEGALTHIDLRSPKAKKSCNRIARASIEAYIEKRSNT